MAFDASLFLRKRAVGSKTTVKVHEHTVKLVGAPSAYTVKALSKLASDQVTESGTVPVQTPKMELDNGGTARTTFQLKPGDASAFIVGTDTRGQTANTNAAANGAAAQ